MTEGLGEVMRVGLRNPVRIVVKVEAKATRKKVAEERRVPARCCSSPHYHTVSDEPGYSGFPMPISWSTRPKSCFNSSAFFNMSNKKEKAGSLYTSPHARQCPISSRSALASPKAFDDEADENAMHRSFLPSPHSRPSSSTLYMDTSRPPSAP